MNDFIQVLISGAARGMIYALLAFGYNITFSTSRTINFSQGDFLMIGAFTGWTISVTLGLGYLPAVLGAGVVGAGLGVLLERVAIRPALRIGSTVSWILATVALGIVIRNAAEHIWTSDQVSFPSPLGSQPLIIGGVRVLPQQLLIIGAAAVIMLAVELFRRRSILGKAVTAVAADKDAAALMGINVPAVITASFVISSAVAAVSGVLVAPETAVTATMGILLGTTAQAVAVMGGLQSGAGVVVGGLTLGLCEKLTARYVSEGYGDTTGFVLLILILLLRPSGIFGRSSVNKV